TSGPAQLCDCPDLCASWWDEAWDQGGDFSPNGVLHYVLDHADADNNNFTGAHAFDVTPFPSSVAPSTDGVVGTPAPEITIAGDTGRGYFGVDYDATATIPIGGIFVDVSRADELEGITVFRATDGLMHVLLLKLSNELDEDDATLHQWITNEP